MKTSTKAAVTVGCAGLALAVAFSLPSVLNALPTFEELPLPGGAELGDNPYTVTAEFEDVLSLVPHSSVKVNDVDVGQVTDIDLAADGWHARVTMRINGDVRLPENAYAAVEQSSLLGEKYIQLLAPEDDEARGQLANGDVIPAQRTNRNVEVEEVFGAMSLVLNGGGIDQIRTISEELNNALGGNELEARGVLEQLEVLVADLDGQREEIVGVLQGMDRLSSTLAERDEVIATTLEEMEPGLATLEDQRASLMAMLNSIDDLGDVAIDTINRTTDDIVADLEALAPIVSNLADAGESLPNSLEVLATYPFTDEVMNGIRGDYLNAYINIAAPRGTQVIPPLSLGENRSGAASDSDTRSAPLPLPAAGGGS
ncbi:MCE family protein [Streptomyces sp. DSM 44917]|uniref:MCE family protein n=1 Tax=Streptomyces boetiae TaxID=3075541 RepID=A0ABU2L8Z5_9ACTN|nr:MCE family protein [Streptomyces sp. DSM 44917]MDT0307946.1 MCE family protein [Streptomyces sp. DSM 44917]